LRRKKSSLVRSTHSAVPPGTEASVRIAPNTKAGASRWVALEVQIAGEPKVFKEIAEITTWYQNETGSYGSGRLLPCRCPIMIAWTRANDRSLKVGDVVKINIMFSERRGNYVGVDAERQIENAPTGAGEKV
jgi:hypothetical protein